jgi:hypothetical protein
MLKHCVRLRSSLKRPSNSCRCAVLQAKADPLPYGVALNQRV